MRHWIAAAVAGLLAGFAPIDTVGGGLMWIAAVIAMAASVRGRVGPDGLRGLLIGALWYGIALRWVAMEWSDLDNSVALPWVAWATVTLLQATIPAIALGIAGAIRSRGWPLAVALAVGLAAAEAAAPWIQPLPGGISVFMAPMQPLLWPAAWAGIAGWLLVLGAWAGLSVRRPLVGVAVLAVWGAIGLSSATPHAPTVAVGIVQPNTGAFDGRRASTADARAARLVRLIAAAQAAGAEVVVTPEGAWPFRLDLRRQRVRDELRAAIPVTTPVLLGVAIDEGERRHNALLVLTAQGPTDRVDKVHLVPVSEQPIWGLGSQVFHRGHRRGPVQLGPAKVAGRICYEDLIPAALRGLGDADLVVSASNDAWLGPNAGSRQHEAGSRLAAVLTGRWLVRPTNNGRSAVFDPSGRRTWHAPWVDGDAQPDHPGIVTVQKVGLRRPWWSGADFDPWLSLAVALLAAALMLRSARPALDPSDARLDAE